MAVWMVALSTTLGIFFAHARTLPSTGGVTGRMEARFVGKFRIWSVYKYKTGEGTVCFAASKPYKLSRRASQDMMLRTYVSRWRQGGNGWQVSLFVRGLAANAKITALLDKQTFVFRRFGDYAFLPRKADETRLVRAMKRGHRLVVKAAQKKRHSGKRGSFVQFYSLNGLTAALKAVQKECGLP